MTIMIIFSPMSLVKQRNEDEKNIIYRKGLVVKKHIILICFFLI